MSRKVEDEAWARQQIADVPAVIALVVIIGLANIATVMIWPDFLPLGWVIFALMVFGGLDELAKTKRARNILNKLSGDAS